jgi:16S rRNA (cytosine967-C5)-methyltransferase
MRPAGFVNAVLRRIGTREMAEWLTIIAPDRAADPAGNLAATCSYPRWIVEAFRDALGEGPDGPLTETEEALAAGNARPKITVAAVPGLAGPDELGEGEASRWSPYGAVLGGGDPGALPAVAEGRAFVQDEASQLVAIALAGAPVEGPDRAWLDLCAGPGGKAAMLGGLGAGRGARLVASDARPHRAGLTRDHLRRLPDAVAVAADGLRGAWPPGSFDRVLADVPCSGLGALRRRPEARWRKSPADVEGLGALQRDLLGAAIDAARPGGVIAYVTCSPHLAETRDVVRDVTAARPDVTVLDAPAVLAGALAEPGSAGDRGTAAEIPGVRSPAPDGRYVQFWPHRHGTDAIFLALLRREPASAGQRPG